MAKKQIWTVKTDDGVHTLAYSYSIIYRGKTVPEGTAAETAAQAPEKTPAGKR